MSFRPGRRAPRDPPRLRYGRGPVGGRGLVERFPCATDRRVTIARLTAAEWEIVQATAPGHVATARRYVIDALTPDQIAQLTQICDALLTRLDPQGAMIDVYNRYNPRPTTDSGVRP